MDILYYVFVFPIEWLMALCLNLAHTLTHSYGFSIIILSLIVNIVLLPLYYLAERWKLDEKLIQKRMAPEIESINTHYSGQERFLLKQSVYRRFGYNPFFALRTSFGFLIQVPFFFAAYVLLTNFEGYRGDSFLFIPDLSLPDGLVATEFGRVNLLPFVMTLVNVASALVYTKFMSRSDQLQLWALAILFLVVLYEAPSGLVFYWTMNNVFSLLKNFIGIRLKLDFLKPALIEEKIENKSIINWIMDKNKIFYIFIIFGFLSIYMAVVVIIHSYYLNWVHLVPALAKGTVVSALIFLCALLFSYFLRKKQFNSIQKYAFTTSFIPLTGIILVISIWLLKIDFLSIAFYPTRYVALFLFATTIILGLAFALDFKGFQWKQNISVLVPLLSATYIGAALFVYQPVIVYSSSPGVFEEKIADILANNIPYFLIFIGIIAVIIAILRKLTTIPESVLLFLFLVFVFYASILPSNYGTLDHFTLADPSVLFKTFGAYLAECVLLLSLIIGGFYLLRKHQKFLILLLIAIHVAAFGEFAYALNKSVATGTPAIEAAARARGKNDSGAQNDALAFSKDGKNVVVLVLDMFTSGLVKNILNERPELKQAYDGFTWYPNTLSISTHTSTSTPAILGGWKYAPLVAHETKPNSIMDWIVGSYHWLMRTVTAKGYAIDLVHPVYFHSSDGDCSKITMEGVHCAQYEDLFPINRIGAESVNFDSRMLSMVSLLKAAPMVIKPFIYNDGYWIAANKDGFTSRAYRHASRNWSFLKFLATGSRVKERGNTFKFLHSDFTHYPYAMNEKCVLRRTVTPDFSIVGEQGTDAAYASAKCALLEIAKWIRWLKINQVYDNTKLIIVSDHGYKNVVDPMLSENFIARAEQDKRRLVSAKRFAQSHALLLVKDFNRTGELNVDHRFMSNADTASIFCSAMGGCPGTKEDPTKGEPDPNRILPVVIPSFIAIDKFKKNSDLEFFWSARVRGNIFEYENWQPVE